MNDFIYLKWTPSIKDMYYEQSKIEDKPKVIGNNVMETILQEGPDFIRNESKRESQFEKMNDSSLVVVETVHSIPLLRKKDTHFGTNQP